MRKLVTTELVIGLVLAAAILGPAAYGLWLLFGGRPPVIDGRSQAELAAMPPGTSIWLVGALSERSQPVAGELLAFVREEYGGEDDNDSPIWIERERRTPELWVRVGDELVRLRGESYRLVGQHRLDQAAGPPQAPLFGTGTMRVRGLLAGGPVVVEGRTLSGDDPVAVSAGALHAMTLDELLADRRRYATGLFIASGMIALAFGWGPLLIMLDNFNGWRRRRQKRRRP